MKIYERKNFPRTANDLKTMYKKGVLSFDNAVQRSFVWKNTKKDNRMSMLIDSMMRGFPIPAMYCNCLFEDAKNKVYDFLDGKQRTTTIIKFLNDEFELVNIPILEDDEDNRYDFNGLTFSQLPEQFQDTIKTYSLTVYYYDNMDQEDAEEMFRRLNNGKSLTAIELSRANAVSKNVISKLGKHELFKKVLSERSITSYVNEDIVVKTWIELFNDKKSFETKDVRPQLKECEITEEQMIIIKNIYDVYLLLLEKIINDKQTKIFKKITNKLQLISLCFILKKVIEENIEIENLKEWIDNFFETENKEVSINSRYNEISKGREAIREKEVKERLQILEENFNQYIEKIDSEEFIKL